MTRLLVADDSETVLLMLRRRLEMSGYDVLTATDGHEALTQVEKAGDKLDLILLDAMMPGKSGIDALKEMIAHPGPYVLDVLVPYQEHVLPMIPSGATVKDIIKS